MGFQPHPKERNRLMRVREELIDEVSLRTDGEKEIFRVNQIVFFSDKYFACMDQAAVYSVGMWIAGRYVEGLPYIIFAMNKYRERIRPYELEKEQFKEGHVLAALDTLIPLL